MTVADQRSFSIDLRAMKIAQQRFHSIHSCPRKNYLFAGFDELRFIRQSLCYIERCPVTGNFIVAAVKPGVDQKDLFAQFHPMLLGAVGNYRVIIFLPPPRTGLTPIYTIAAGTAIHIFIFGTDGHSIGVISKFND